jgi:hypothetical protein
MPWRRGFDSRNNLRYITNKPTDGQYGGGADEGEAPRCFVYPSAALGIVFDVKANTQRFYHGHTDDIISLALHPVWSGARFSATTAVGSGLSLWA